jgi:hypothetical protein
MTPLHARSPLQPPPSFDRVTSPLHYLAHIIRSKLSNTNAEFKGSHKTLYEGSQMSRENGCKTSQLAWFDGNIYIGTLGIKKFLGESNSATELCILSHGVGDNGVGRNFCRQSDEVIKKSDFFLSWYLNYFPILPTEWSRISSRLLKLDSYIGCWHLTLYGSQLKVGYRTKYADDFLTCVPDWCSSH